VTPDKSEERVTPGQKRKEREETEPPVRIHSLNVP
jgi:hypothetical protein